MESARNITMYPVEGSCGRTPRTGAGWTAKGGDKIWQETLQRAIPVENARLDTVIVLNDITDLTALYAGLRADPLANMAVLFRSKEVHCGSEKVPVKLYVAIFSASTLSQAVTAGGKYAFAGVETGLPANLESLDSTLVGTVEYVDYGR